MKLEWISDLYEEFELDGVDSDEIVRFFEFTMNEADLLSKAIRYFVLEQKEKLDVTRLTFVEALNCNLIFVLATEDIGIEYVEKVGFVCGLTFEGYEKMLSLMEPFTKRDLKSYQWLYDLDTPVDLLFSPKGSW